MLRPSLALLLSLGVLAAARPTDATCRPSRDRAPHWTVLTQDCRALGRLVHSPQDDRPSRLVPVTLADPAPLRVTLAPRDPLLLAPLQSTFCCTAGGTSSGCTHNLGVLPDPAPRFHVSTEDGRWVGRSSVTVRVCAGQRVLGLDRQLTPGRYRLQWEDGRQPAVAFVVVRQAPRYTLPVTGAAVTTPRPPRGRGCASCAVGGAPVEPGVWLLLAAPVSLLLRAATRSPRARRGVR